MSHIIFTCTGKEWRAVLLLSLCIPELILEVRYRLTGYKSFWVLTMNVLQWSKSWLFFLISPVKSQMLGRPVINLVWTELRISTAQYGRKLFFFRNMHTPSEQRASMSYPVWEWPGLYALPLQSCPWPFTCSKRGKVQQTVFLISKAYADWIAFSIQAKMPVFCLHF